tara:strand:+ start:96 stop:377 length:282 start_codon:yes stop_codon:yes gene_type:complete
MKTKEQLKKEINALRQNICWVHGDDLLKGIAEPSYGIPSGYDSEVQKEFPFHGLFVDLGCLAATSDQIKGQVTNVCPTCKKKALIYLEAVESE